MKIHTKTVERASTDIPHDVFVRFLRSLGADIPADVKVYVIQAGVYSDKKPAVHVHWDLSEEEESREVSLMSEEDLKIVAGLHDDSSIHGKG